MILRLLYLNISSHQVALMLTNYLVGLIVTQEFVLRNIGETLPSKNIKELTRWLERMPQSQKPGGCWEDLLGPGNKAAGAVIAPWHSSLNHMRTQDLPKSPVGSAVAFIVPLTAI